MNAASTPAMAEIAEIAEITETLETPATTATSPVATKIYLVRHGETAWALTGQHTGRTDLPLTSHGEEEARELAHFLSQISFAHVLCSPLQRARQTCELAELNATVEIVPDLMEWDYGDYEGQRSVDIRQQRVEWNIFQDGCPNGEMPAQVAARADRLIAHLHTLQGNIALFSHGQFGRVLAARWIGLAPLEAQHLSLNTASLSILSHDPHHPTVTVIALWNAAAHGTFDARHAPRIGDARPMKQRALERWENEGGELKVPQHTAQTHADKEK